MGQGWQLANRRLHIFYGNWNANHHLGTGFFVHKGIISAIKRVKFITESMSYI
jgi:hypothetical protein